MHRQPEPHRRPALFQPRAAPRGAQRRPPPAPFDAARTPAHAGEEAPEGLIDTTADEVLRQRYCCWGWACQGSQLSLNHMELPLCLRCRLVQMSAQLVDTRLDVADVHDQQLQQLPPALGVERRGKPAPNAVPPRSVRAPHGTSRPARAPPTSRDKSVADPRPARESGPPPA